MYASGAGCGGGFFELLRSARAYGAEPKAVGAAALDNAYQWYGSFVVGTGYACHPYAGGQFLMPVIKNFSPDPLYMSGSYSVGSAC